jgi:hypothetical protein
MPADGGLMTVPHWLQWLLFASLIVAGSKRSTQVPLHVPSHSLWLVQNQLCCVIGPCLQQHVADPCLQLTGADA